MSFIITFSRAAAFWNLSPEQENRMMQNTREYLIRKKGIKKEEITIARNMIKKRYET